MKRDFLLHNTLVISAVSGLGAISGFAATAVLLVYFGLSHDADAYFVAIWIPRLLAIIFSSSVQFVLVPHISGDREGTVSPAHQHLLNNLLTHAYTLALVICPILWVLSPYIVRLLSPGFDENVAEICTRVFRYALIAIGLRFPFDTLSSFLNTRGVFARVAAMDTLRNLIIVLAVLLFSQRMGIDAAAAGFAFGSAVQFLYLAGLAQRHGLRLRFIFDSADPALRNLARQLWYPMGGSAANLTPTLLQRFLASFLPEGSVTAFSVAQQIVQMLYVVTTRGVGIVSHPLVSQFAVQNDRDALSAALTRSLKLTSLIGCAVFVLLAATAHDGVALLSGFKSFSRDHALAISNLAAILAAMLPLNGMVAILRSPHYALGRPLLPSLHMALTGAVHIVFQFLLFYPFGVTGLAIAEVAWAVCSFLSGLLLLPPACRQIIPAVWGTLTKTTVVAWTLGGLLFAFSYAIRIEWVETSRAARALWLIFMSGATCVIMWAIGATALRSHYRSLFPEYKAHP